ncbi:transposase, partial [Empedobacter sp.]
RNEIQIGEVLADAGYSSGTSLQYCEDHNLDAWIPNFGQYKPEREGFIFNKKENRYECIQEGGNKAFLPFKRTLTATQVTFQYKDYRNNGQNKQMVLPNHEFIRRFSLHILPKRFVRIRHYGILSSSWKRGKLQDLQKQLKVKRKESKIKTKHRLCYCCKEGNLVTLALFGDRGPPKTYLFKSEVNSPVN